MHPKRPVISLTSLLILVCLMTGMLYGFSKSHAASSTIEALIAGDKKAEQKSQERAKDDYGKLPISFVANKGQTDEQVKYMSRGRGYSLYLTSTEAVLVLTRTSEKQDVKSATATKDTQPPLQQSATETQHVVRMELVGANKNPRVEALDELPGKVNYLVGNDASQWQTNLQTFAKVQYEEIYPGVNLIYYGNQRQLEYDFVISPGADPRVIKFQIAGADQLKVNNKGDLMIEVSGDVVTLHKPFSYQVAENGEQREVPGRYVVKSGGQIVFELGKFDARKTLVIDPILVYSTEIGSGGGEYASGIAVDDSGSAYITGSANFGGYPTTPGSLKPTSNGGNAFVTKLSPDGSSLVYSTFLGGGGTDTANGIAVDSSGNAYVTGYTLSANFPTVNAVRGNNGNLLRSADAGDHWVSQSIASPISQVNVFAVDPLAPNTIYAGVGFNNTIVNRGVYKSTDGGNTWSPLNTGLTNASCSAIVIDPSTPSTIYAALTPSNFTGSGVYKSTDGGNSWVSVSSGLNSLSVSALAIDPQTPTTLYAGTQSGLYKSINGGASWSASSSGINFSLFYSIVVDPVTPTTVYASAGGGGVFKSTNSGANWSQTNAGLTNTTVRTLAIHPTSTAIIYAGTAGGGVFKSANGGGNWTAVSTGLPANTVATSLSLNPLAPATLYLATANGRIFKTVDGANSWSKIYETLASTNFAALAISPGTPSTILAGSSTGSSSNDYEAFVSKLNPQGSGLVYSTYLGGSSNDFGRSIAVDSGGNAFVTGETTSSSFLLMNPFQSTLKGTQDAFVTKFDSAGALAYSTYLGGTNIDTGYGISVDSSGSAYLTGSTSSGDFPLVNPIAGTTGGIFVTKMNQAGTGLVYSTLLGTGTGFDITVDVTGNAYVTGSVGNNLPTTPGAFQTAPLGGCCGSGTDDAFVSKLNPAGNGLIYSTYLAGTDRETGRGIALDNSGNAYVTGFTSSADYPLAVGALRSKSPFFKSTNGAASWSNDNYGFKGDIVTALAINPQAPSTIYAGTRTGALKSTDGGNNWTQINTGLGSASVVAIVVDPATPSTVYLAADRVYKSTDGGSHWSLASTGMSGFSLMSLAIDPVTPATLYVGTYGGPIYKTINAATTWTASSNPQTLSFVVSIAVDPITPTTIYAAADMSNGGIFKSTDGGGNWQRIANTQISAYGQSVTVNPVNPSIVFASSLSTGLFKSTDGGSNWTMARAQGGRVVFDPQNPSTIYLLTSFDGLLKSTNGGQSWSPINNGLTYLMVSALVVNPARPSTIYVGSQIYPSGDAAFVTKLNSSGSALIYSTLLDGGGAQATSIAVDTGGNAYVAGVTHSPGFMTTPDSYQPFHVAFDDVFVAKLGMSYVISGQVLDGNSLPLGGVEVTLSGAQLRSVVTEDDGSYRFTHLPEGGSFTVSVSKPQYSFTPPSQSFNNLHSNQTANFTAASTNAPFYTISGRVTNGGAGLANVTVTLGGSQIGLTSTDANGNYSFTVPGGGNYTVTPSILGFSLSPANQAFNNISANQTADFTASRLNFVVINTNDHGSGSLRQAILDANATAEADTIVFNIPGSGVRTITSRVALPDITDPVTIDGTTQPGFAGTPLIELSGGSAPNADGLKIVAGNCTVRGLVINGFSGNGIFIIGGGNNVIQGNYIGIDPTGTLRRGNHTGIAISSSSNNVIGGTTAAARNVISASGFDGMVINSSSGNLVQGNFIGTNAAGTASLGNGIDGLVVSGLPAASFGNLIGGVTPGAGNLISGNQDGLEISGAGNTVQGNLIGTDITGTKRVGNNVGIRATNVIIGGTVPGARNLISGNGEGIYIGGATALLQGNFIGTDITGTAALGNSGNGVVAGNHATIGGTTPEARNIISGNGFSNIALGYNSSGDAATVQGNYIGTDMSGAVALDNPGNGITISSPNNIIGGLTADARNVISGNEVGIQIGGSISSTVTGNVIQGNYFGLNAAGNAPLANKSFGIAFSNAANNIIGGTQNGAGNVIAFSDGAGAAVHSGTGNVIRGNSIFSNARVGIDLRGDEVTANDAGDVDTGANELQNFPVLTSVTSSGGSTTIQGTLNSKANKTYDIDFYSNLMCDASGYGEGARFFNSTQVTTDQSGNANINVTFPAALSANRVITATATDPVGNTSEFSSCNAGDTVGSVEFSAAGYNVLEDVGSATITVIRTGGSKGTLTVKYSTGGGTATAGTDYTPASGTLNFADGETTKTFIISIANDGVTEPDETVRLTLSDVPELEMLGANSTVNMTIQDNSTPLFLNGATASAPEGNAGTTNAVVTVNLSAATGRTVTVAFSTVDFNQGGAQALAGLDYQAVNGTLTFGPGVTSQSVTVPIIGDTLDEFDESFSILLTNPTNASIHDHPLIFIADDDAAPSISIDDLILNEGNAGTTNAVIPVRLSGVSGKLVRFSYATANGTATAGSDYSAALGTLVFSPGETTKNITVLVNGDTAVETNETFFINLTSPVNAPISRAQGVVTINNDDSQTPQLQFSQASYTVGEAVGSAQLIVNRTDTTAAATVDYATSDISGLNACASVTGNASSRCDYAISIGTLRFAAGEASKTIYIPIVDDNITDGNETFTITLSNPSGATLGSNTSATVNITDNANTAGNPIDTAEFFIRQHYIDFLGREPEPSGLAGWLNVYNNCGITVQQPCDRIEISSAFFRSEEFQNRAYFVYRFYSAVGKIPLYEGFMPDFAKVSGFLSAQDLEANKVAFVNEFMTRSDFQTKYGALTDPTSYVDALLQTVGLSNHPQRDFWIASLTNGSLTRAQVLRAVVESGEVYQKYYNEAFVIMQYFGYLRRSADISYLSWIQTMNSNGGDYRVMINGFLNSQEYRDRFGN